MEKLHNSIKTVKRIDENELLMELIRYKEIYRERLLKYETNTVELQNLTNIIQLLKEKQIRSSQDGLTLRKTTIDLNKNLQFKLKLLKKSEEQKLELQKTEDRIKFVEDKLKEHLKEKKAFDNFFEDKLSVERALKQFKQDEEE